MNSNIVKIALVFMLSLGGSVVQAYESLGLSSEQQECFSYAMIGMDSVINSRLGLPPEHALEISRVTNVRTADEKFDNVVLNVMLNAYLWQTSPHSYAIKVFYECAKNNTKHRQAKY